MAKGRPKKIPNENEVYDSVEGHLADMRSEYELRWENSVLHRWSRGSWVADSDDGELSLSDAMNKLSRSGHQIVSRAHTAMVEKEESERKNGKTERESKRAGLKAAYNIFVGAPDSEIDPDLSHTIYQHWEFLRTKSKGRQTAKRHIVSAPDGEPIVSYPPGLLTAALKASSSDLGYSVSRTREIWIAVKKRISDDLRDYKPNVG